MRRLVPTFMAAALLAVGACSDDGGGGGDAAAPTTVTTAAPTTVAPTTSTTAAPILAPQASGADAVNALLDAWRNGDRATALTVASAEAVDALFAIPPEPGQARGCNQGGANVNVQCVYRLSAGELQVRAAPSPDGAGYLVDFVILGS